MGRQAEVEQLHGLLERAWRGERQVVFITGEAGIGKTTVVDAFLAQVGQAQNRKSKSHEFSFTPSRLHSFTPSLPLVGRGQCLEQYGQGEPYLPVLEAVGQLCRGPDGQQVKAVLRRYAPLWLAQMPGVVEETELAALQQRVLGATRERMVRELAEALEVLTAERGVVLVLEDLQVSDYSTIELLAYLAQRRERARLLIIGTYRPAEVVVKGHVLRGMAQELRAHEQCQELQLELLSAADVTEYVSKRLGTGVVSRAVGKQVHERTEGNALFLVNVVEYLLRQRVLQEVEGCWQLGGELERVGIPESVQQVIEKQIEMLGSEEQRVLEVASVAGIEFSAAAVAAGIEAAVEEVEARCAKLVRQGYFLRAVGVSEWPDGMVAARYSFIHALYQNVLYERVPAGRRSELHRRIGTREEAAYGSRAGEIAAELAMRFERGRDYQRAVQYHQQAAKTAMQRSANQEAIDHLTKGLELLKVLPDTPERTQQEIMLQTALGAPLMATKSWSAPEVEQAYTRARELCRQAEETPQLFLVLWGLYRFYLGRGEHSTARELAEQLLRLAHGVLDSVFSTVAHSSLGVVLFLLGDLGPAREHLEQGIILYDRQQHRLFSSLQGDDPGVAGLSFGAWALWLRGYPDQALKRSHEALILAQELTHPFIVASALGWSSWLHHSRRERPVVQERAEAALTLATEQGFAYWVAMGTMMRGWALAARGEGEEGLRGSPEITRQGPASPLFTLRQAQGERAGGGNR